MIRVFFDLVGVVGVCRLICCGIVFIKSVTMSFLLRFVSPTSQLVTPAQDSRLADQINHPAHLVREEGNLSLSAFIPLCQLGDEMSVIRTQIR